jgi:hypothetical protein
MTPLSSDDILLIAKSKGEFRVTLRWRDDTLRAKCRQMRREGLLTGGRKIIHGAVYFYPVKEKPNGDV